MHCDHSSTAFSSLRSPQQSVGIVLYGLYKPAAISSKPIMRVQLERSEQTTLSRSKRSVASDDAQLQLVQPKVLLRDWQLR